MKAKLERCWRQYKKHWTVRMPNNRKNPFRDDAELHNRMRFEQYVCKQLKCQTKIEWQEDGGVIVAGVIAFCLT